jgi:chromosome segregation ATPase
MPPIVFADWQIDAREFYEWLCSKNISGACNHQGRYSYLGNYSTKEECENARYSSCGGNGDAASMSRSRCIGQDDKEQAEAIERNREEEEKKFQEQIRDIQESLDRHEKNSKEFKDKIFEERNINNNVSKITESRKLTKSNPIVKKDEKEILKSSIKNSYCAALMTLNAARMELDESAFSRLNSKSENMRDKSGLGFDKPQTGCPEIDIPIPSVRTSPEFEKVEGLYNRVIGINSRLNEIIPEIKQVKQSSRQIENKINENEKKVKELKKKKEIIKSPDNQSHDTELDDLLKEATDLLSEASNQKEKSKELLNKIEFFEKELNSVTADIISMKGI